jgi:CheY-like chemotaxis protein
VKDSKFRALVVDDNEVNTLILANMLELFGIRVDQVFSGEAAVNMYKKNTYDLVFIDHLMPDMDGIKTTEILRSQSTDRTAIFALTSCVTENIKYIYREKGANDVFSKPLGLTEVIMILKEWFPQLSMEEDSLIQSSSSPEACKEDLLRSMLSELPEINYEVGLKYAIGNPAHFLRILRISVKDILTCINQIIQSHKQYNMDGMSIGIHNLKSLFSNIGAEDLYECTRNMHRMIRHGEYDKFKTELSQYIIKIDSFNFRLENVINQIEAIENTDRNDRKDEHYVMSEQEYEQCLTDTIYYIMSFEYDSIIRKLQQLIRDGLPEKKIEFIKALEEINDFDYDNALARISRLKEKDR